MSPPAMPYALNEEHTNVAFSGGTLIDAGKPVRFRLVEVGRLEVTSGAITASDPFVMFDPKGFLQRVPVGSYPVSLAVAIHDNEDERVAFARVQLSDQVPRRWQMAIHAGQDAASLKEDEYFGYGVDSGTGCFMDPIAGELLRERMDGDQKWYEAMADDMEKTYRHTRSWCNYRPASDRRENIICFSSGLGDGSYPSFFGFADGAQPVSLITDFLVLMGDVSEPREEVKPWWKFWS